MKILMAPVNVAGQPITLVNHLRQKGIDISLLQYSNRSANKYGYQSDRVIEFPHKTRLRRAVEVEALIQTLEENIDIYHFWMTTFFSGHRFDNLFGMDLPFLKMRGKKIIYRSTGFDVRTRAKHIAVNPYHAFQYGYSLGIDEKLQAAYLDYLREMVDLFVVQDPEMLEYLPGARVVPRAFDFMHWPEIGIKPSENPLIVHAPSNPKVKGTQFIMQALDELKREGYRFRVKLIQNMNQEEARTWYKQADICIDQLLIGWYGVFTLECLALGKPVIVYIRPDLYEKFKPAIPIENANPDNIKIKLKLLITDFERRRELATPARKFVQEVHDVELVAQQMIAIYQEVHKKPCKPPSSYADLNYFLMQCQNNHQGFKSMVDKVAHRVYRELGKRTAKFFYDLRYRIKY